MTCPECGRLWRTVNAACTTHDAYEERAALREYQGGQDRKQAEAEAQKEATTQHLSRWGQA